MTVAEIPSSALGPVLTRRIARFDVVDDLILGADRAVTYERSV